MVVVEVVVDVVVVEIEVLVDVVVVASCTVEVLVAATVEVVPSAVEEEVVVVVVSGTLRPQPYRINPNNQIPNPKQIPINNIRIILLRI